MAKQHTPEEIAAVRAEMMSIKLARQRVQEVKEQLAREERLRFFKPLPKQTEVHLCGKRSVWLFGGNRSSKTVTGSIKDVLFALGPKAAEYIADWPEAYELKGQIYDTRREEYLGLVKSLPSKSVGWICSESFEVQRDVVQSEVMRWLPKPEIRRVTYRMKDVIDQIHLKNGSKITFKSYDQGREKFQGAKINWVHLDEEPPEDIYREILMRLMDSKGYLWATMTPALKGVTFVYQFPEMLNLPDDQRDPELYVMFMSWEDNPYLDDEEKKRMEGNMREDEIEARKYGRMIAPGKSPFSLKALREMRERLVREPVRGNLRWRDTAFSDVEWEELGDGDYMLWVPPEPGHEYIVAADVAEGLEHGDFSVCGALDRHTQELCCVWHGKVDADVFGDVIHRLAKFYNDAVEAPERNNHGLTAISTIKQFPDHNLFRMKTMGKRVDMEGEAYGWYTSFTTKPVMVDALAKAVREQSINVYWSRFYDECLNFVRDAKGRYGARHGAFDDVVMMMAIGLQVHDLLGTTVNMPAPFRRRVGDKQNLKPWEREAEKQQAEQEWSEEPWD